MRTSSAPPTAPGASEASIARYSPRCAASEPPASSAPPATSTASAPAVPRTTERDRGGMSRNSRGHGASARAPPRPPAHRASRNPAMTASTRDGSASRERLARASAPHSAAYGAASASAAYPRSLSLVSSAVRTIQRPARHSSAPGIRTRPSGSIPIRPAPDTVISTWWAASHRQVAVRTTPGRPRPEWGAAIHPASTSGVRMTSPVAVTTDAASAPETTRGRVPPTGGVALPGRVPASGRVGAVTPPSWQPHRDSPDPPRRPRTCNRDRGSGPVARAGRQQVTRRAALHYGPEGRAFSRLAGQYLVAGHDLADKARRLAGRAAHPDTDLLQGLLLGLGGARRTRHDGPGMAHRLALRGGEPGHVGDHRLGDVLLDEGGGPLLRVPADLADHHDRVGFRVVGEGAQAVDVGGPDHRVAADADGGREADVAQFVHHLVGQRARLGHQADPAFRRDVRRDDARVGLAG